MGLKAVLCLVFNKGSILSVTRGGQPGNLGFPGGMVEEGEELYTAALRELKEETGIVGVLASCAEENSFQQGDKTIHVVYVSEWSGDLVEGPEGTPAWSAPQEFSSELCKYRESNKKILQNYKGSIVMSDSSFGYIVWFKYLEADRVYTRIESGYELEADALDQMRECILQVSDEYNGTSFIEGKLAKFTDRGTKILLDN